MRGNKLRWLAACLVALPIAAATAQPQLPAVEDFFGNSAFGDPVFSPNGLQLAIRAAAKGRRYALAVIDLEKGAARIVAEYDDEDIGEFHWVNDNRLVYNLQDGATASGDWRFAPGLFAVNRDASQRVQLADGNGVRMAPQPWNTFLLSQPGSQDSDFIYVQRPVYDTWDKFEDTRLFKLNTFSGRTVPASEPKVPVSRYILDFTGEPRLAIVYGDRLTVFHYRDPATDIWREVAAFENYTNAQEEIVPLGFGPDGTLYVVANAGEDTASLRAFDFMTGKPGKEALVSIPGYDFAGSLVSNNQLLGVRLTADAEANVWFDPAWKAVQSAVDKAFPGVNNLITVPRNPASPWVLVESYSDVQPHQYVLFNKTSGAVNFIGNAHPNIRSAEMGRQQVVRYKARDGREIPGLLTLPAGGRRQGLPMIVLVHGGPWVRGGSWGWKAESQFLASRGYAVLEPEFRGSTGFGVAHFEAGIKQWGLAMQNDIADGTRWAIAQGIADPRRICIAGGSYGGYATLMGLVNDPDLFRCGVEWAGVTDIELMYTGTWWSKSDASEGYLRYGMPMLIGDRIADAAQLKATSPIKQAARIQQPLLLAYGSEDKRVPIYHGEKFRAAVKQTNKQVEWVEYSGEGHGWSLQKNRIDFWLRVETFLGKHIGPAPEPAP